MTKSQIYRYTTTQLEYINQTNINIVVGETNRQRQQKKHNSIIGHLNTNNFYFIFFYFSDFTFLFF